ncbi:hypothetical protein [Saliterribacillus persicus]|uniref:Uncharacterized protein n=1 Tax=Saliterribacillus persicus TaxID=930114 RepID=A0A368X8U8_9BACI|nr:hypothetical protein [Saliterribacillus persicus]RCW62857.1 hypothetical protein DFR57_12226 [Saliterribacillus persicus]
MHDFIENLKLMIIIWFWKLKKVWKKVTTRKSTIPTGPHPELSSKVTPIERDVYSRIFTDGFIEPEIFMNRQIAENIIKELPFNYHLPSETTLEVISDAASLPKATEKEEAVTPVKDTENMNEEQIAEDIQAKLPSNYAFPEPLLSNDEASHIRGVS